jgi:hypothetical protein
MTRPAIFGALAALLATLAAGGCDRKGSQHDLNEAKRMPKPPPPAAVIVPADLRIAVEIDGRESAPIDAAFLDARPPDFADTDRRAWRIDSLLGEAAQREGALIAVTGERGLTIELGRGDDGGVGPVPVLTVSRRGEVLAAMVESGEPFPPYHGRGGRLGRPGDHLPRIGGVTKISVRLREDAGSR